MAWKKEMFQSPSLQKCLAALVLLDASWHSNSWWLFQYAVRPAKGELIVEWLVVINNSADFSYGCKTFFFCNETNPHRISQPLRAIQIQGPRRSPEKNCNQNASHSPRPWQIVRSCNMAHTIWTAASSIRCYTANFTSSFPENLFQPFKLISSSRNRFYAFGKSQTKVSICWPIIALFHQGNTSQYQTLRSDNMWLWSEIWTISKQPTVSLKANVCLSGLVTEIIYLLQYKQFCWAIWTMFITWWMHW